MYQVWSNFLNPGQIAMLGIVVTFLLPFLALKHPFSFLPPAENCAASAS